ncbi:FAD-dependent monooxygenase [Comamonas flocculans]|uniref:3-hydroxybenzoate 4-monooxygenase n=1 Tax=Comamonas flocculans TaxID=2597701 RepID=A0A5B8RUA6_9BURK|nr:FAD-dependent monooxygenase [Comamonas flocculans]QEA13070.1 3-hydroxybenzoate 4-monooxygenase [Comamonas flocculans]
MQFHHHGYVSSDPRVQPAAGTGLDRPTQLPGEVDVLVVGAGPAGMIVAAQLSQFAGIHTRIIDRRASRLEIGQADGIQKRSVETFEAFGFADEIVAEGCEVTQTVFWKPDPLDPARIVRASREPEDEHGVSEYPHILVNQARVLDYFGQVMRRAPTRMQVDYGLELQELRLAEHGQYPVSALLRHTAGEHEGQMRTVRARYVVGADGAHSRVRRAVGCEFQGSASNHAWGVIDLLAVTDFPDVRTKCVIKSGEGGSILLIPREGGFMFRLYVDLGEVEPGAGGAVRQTTVEQTIARARSILRPYALDVRHVAWYSVYEVGHRVCDRFDDVPAQQRGARTPRVFIAGDAAHTHSAKAGQGMNVSMQDGFNLGWKLAHVLEGRSPESLLASYSAERQVIGQDIIDFDRRWATMMATPPEQLGSPEEVEAAYAQITEFAQGFMTQYAPSSITGKATYQHLATGFPIGRRFKSARVVRVADARPLHLGHQARADGRWRLYVFADAARAHEDSPAAALGSWLADAPESPVRAHTPVGRDDNAWFDIKIIYQQPHEAVAIEQVPLAYKPRVGPWQLVDYENVFATLPGEDIFALRGIDRAGAIVVVRPDQYVAHVLPLAARAELAAFLRGFLRPRS